MSYTEIPEKVNTVDILYGEYIKYDRLYEMTMHAFCGNDKIDRTDIYVDLYSILRKLYHFGDRLEVDDSCGIASSIINLAIHLRGFFNKMGIYSRIFLVYGEPRDPNILEAMPNYNAAHILQEDTNSLLTDRIMDALKLCLLYTPYLPDIFTFVDLGSEFSTMIAQRIVKDFDSNKTGKGYIIYSKELLAYQLVATCPRTFLYRPKKNYMNDNSWVVTKTSLYKAYGVGELGLKPLEDESLYNLPSKLFPMAQLLSGVKSRYKMRINNFNIILKIFNKAFKNNEFNGYSYFSIASLPLESNPIYKIMTNPEYKINKPESVESFTKLFSIIDQYYRSSIYPAYKIIDLDFNLMNLSDDKAVKEINEKYFYKYPIDLMKL